MWGGDRIDSVPCTSASEDGIEVTYIVPGALLSRLSTITPQVGKGEVWGGARIDSVP